MLRIHMAIAIVSIVMNCADADEREARTPLAVRVMSFNLRYATADDGDNRWELRRDRLIKTIQEFSPDLLGTQETLPQQVQYIGERLPQYGHVGRSREADISAAGEQCAVFYRRERFTILDQGHFWLSDQPDLPGSRGWDGALPRMATWLRLEDRVTKKSLHFINTHFDHVGKEARLQSARLLRRKLAELPVATPLVVTGDFNCGVDSPPYAALMAPGPPDLVDVFRQLHPDRVSHVGTFHGFQGNDDGPRIDWVAANGDWRTIEADIVKTHEQGRYPSDHFPVTAVLLPR